MKKDIDIEPMVIKAIFVTFIIFLKVSLDWDARARLCGISIKSKLFLSIFWSTVILIPSLYLNYFFFQLCYQLQLWLSRYMPRPQAMSFINLLLKINQLYQCGRAYLLYFYLEKLCADIQLCAHLCVMAQERDNNSVRK